VPRILHLITSLNRGGIETWLLSMLREVSRSDCEMDFCCKGSEIGSLADLAKQMGAKIHHCPLGPMHIGFANNLRQILIEGKYDLLHNHLETYSGFPVWVAQQLGIPIITSFHNTRFDPQTPLTRLPILRQMRSIYRNLSVSYALQHSTLLTGCSQGVLDSLQPSEKGFKIPSRILYYGVDIPPPSTPEDRNSLRNSLGWEVSTPLILHVGRFIEQKNHLGLLSVFQRVLESIPSAKLLLVGLGPLKALVEENIAKRDLASSVRMLGLRDDVPTLMTKSDVFLFPSLYEGFGLVAVESNAAGLPLVGSSIPGLAEAVQNGKTALLHDVDDIESMAASIVKILSDRHYSQQLASAGREWVEANYSTAASARKLLETYKAFV
jgi:glycosyltransferase EpsF